MEGTGPSTARRLLQEDTRNKCGSHDAKNSYWKDAGVEVFRSKLVVGDYALAPKISIDTKQSLQELATDLYQQHDRFRRECELAQHIGTLLVVLVETGHPVRCLDDLERWVEPDAELERRRRKSPRARRLTGYPLARICRTMTEKYGVGWAFCAPEDAGREVLAIIAEFEGDDERG